VTTRIGDHALVLGASIGGLLAARVLADWFSRVTIVDRDALPDTAASRRGVPQGRHAHGLLTVGADVVDELFPGLLDDLVSTGATVIRDVDEIHFAPRGRKLCLEPRAEPMRIYQPSRPYLEGRIRARLRSCANVEVIDHCKAIDLDAAPTADRVKGAVVRPAGQPERLLEADLVVDATGRAGRARSWLAAMGYATPYEDRVEVDIRYVSRHLRLRQGALGREKVLIVGAEPGRPTGANLLKQEGNCWILTLIGYRGFHPPTDPDGFIEFARTVVPAHVFDAIRDCDPVDEPVAHRFAASVRRRYEQLTRFPAGLLVFGDALCSFNPIYGQGMSSAGLQAMALRECLAAGRTDLATRFFKTAGRRIEPAWRLAAGADLALPEVDGHRPPSIRIANAYIAQVLRAAERDRVVAERFMSVSSLVAPPSVLINPLVAGRVLAATWGHRRAGPFSPWARLLDLSNPLKETR
jgi:2-polyprenyl-6-methoxyphenol hydroxylase-like FAD-dependent oxidoreductase